MEYQQLKAQVKGLAQFLGAPEGAGTAGPLQASPAPRAPQPPDAERAAAAAAQPWGTPGREPPPKGSVADGLSQVAGEVEGLKRQLAQMGQQQQAMGYAGPAAAAAAAAANQEVRLRQGG